MNKSEYTEEMWRETYKKGGRGTVMSPQWLRNGCPMCGCKTWDVTSDCYAYCDDCYKGYHTDYPFTFEILSKLN